MIAFNFFFLAPVHTLTLADGRNWTALAVYVVTGVVASELAARARRRAAEAEQREREAALLADAAAELLHRDAAARRDPRACRRRARTAADERARARFDAALERCSTVSPRSASASRTRRVRRRRFDASDADQDNDHPVGLARLPHAARDDGRSRCGGLSSSEVELSATDRAELLDTIGRELARLDAPGREPARPLAAPGRRGRAAPRALGRRTSSCARRRRGSADAVTRSTSPDDLPPARVDAVQVQRMLVNLIENALKFSPAAAPVHRSARRRRRRSCVEVVDRGRGIRAEEADALLEPFDARRRRSAAARASGLRSRAASPSRTAGRLRSCRVTAAGRSRARASGRARARAALPT